MEMGILQIIMGFNLKSLIVKMQHICNLIDGNSVHISDIFNCYSTNINGM